MASEVIHPARAPGRLDAPGLFANDDEETATCPK
jgi:hypothetical protein